MILLSKLIRRIYFYFYPPKPMPADVPPKRYTHAVASGNWYDPTIWSLQDIPKPGDYVNANGHAITISGTVVAHTLSIVPNGGVFIATGRSTRVIANLVAKHTEASIRSGTPHTAIEIIDPFGSDE